MENKYTTSALFSTEWARHNVKSEGFFSDLKIPIFSIDVVRWYPSFPILNVPPPLPLHRTAFLGTALTSKRQRRFRTFDRGFPRCPQHHVVQTNIVTRFNRTAIEKPHNFASARATDIVQRNVMKLTRMDLAVRCRAGPWAISSQDRQRRVHTVQDNVFVMNIVHTASGTGVRFDTNAPRTVQPLRVAKTTRGSHVFKRHIAHGAVPNATDGNAVPSLARDVANTNVSATATGLGWIAVGAGVGPLPNGHHRNTIVAVADQTIGETLILPPVKIDAVRIGRLVRRFHVHIVDPDVGARIHFDKMIGGVAQMQIVHAYAHNVAKGN